MTISIDLVNLCTPAELSRREGKVIYWDRGDSHGTICQLQLTTDLPRPINLVTIPLMGRGEGEGEEEKEEEGKKMIQTVQFSNIIIIV